MLHSVFMVIVFTFRVEEIRMPMLPLSCIDLLKRDNRFVYYGTRYFRSTNITTMLHSVFMVIVFTFMVGNIGMPTQPSPFIDAKNEKNTEK